ncbi:MAG: Gfo/Idh/MocA family protein, partial [Promethearchaeota archaeon]
FKDDVTIYHNLEEMIDDVDIIDIATPPKIHISNLKLAVNAGKHVLCEKPLARNWWAIHENADVIKTIQQKSLKFQLHTQGIWNPLIKAGRELLDRKVIGEIERIRISHQGADPKHTINLPALWNKHHSGGGALMDIGPHAYASMWYWLGGNCMPEKVKAELLKATIPTRTIAGRPNTKVEVEDDAHVIIYWKDPEQRTIVGELEATWNKKDWFQGKKGSKLAPEIYYEVEGTKGILSFPHIKINFLKPPFISASFKIQYKESGKISYIRHPVPAKKIEDFIFFDEFADVIANKKEGRNDILFAEQMLKVFGAAYLSKKTGNVVSLAEFENYCTNISKTKKDLETRITAIIDDLFS